MKQIIQDLKTGETILEEVPAPQIKAGCVLIKTRCTLVSLGTERMLVEFGKANYINKARQQPDRVKQVINKIKTDGLQPTINAVFNKLNQPIPLGYCNVGEVIAVGKGVSEFSIGDRVVSNGNHAEYVCIPKNLVAKIPDSVTDEEAAFTVIGSIGLEGIRLLQPQLGESVVVIGLGLIGLIVVQLLKANGCKVIGIDYDQQKVEIANSLGINAINPAQGTDAIKFVHTFTDNNGADGVIITASSQSNDIIHEACEMSRKRGKIVLIGVVGLNMRRDDFYKKELSFQVSCSYGPGRYDENYEAKGIDYPLPYVRWTEKRNFEAILHTISTHSLNVNRLITEDIPLENFQEVYGDMRKAGSIASIIRYNPKPISSPSIYCNIEHISKPSTGKIGIIGAGNFTLSTIIPSLLKAKARVKYISARTNGLAAKIAAKKMGADIATTDYRQILNDPEIDMVICSTRHNAHAKMIVESLNAGKSVFVEKPLCLNEKEMSDIVETYNQSDKSLTINVGFNRRFSPYAMKMKALLGDGPMNIVATMNAGSIPQDVWVHDLEVGGGRIIGEACHFIDLCSYLTGSKIVSVCANALGVNPQENCDNMSILLKYENGANAVINYFANGANSYPKENIQVFYQEKVLTLDNWRTLKCFGFKNFSKMSGTMDKGHNTEFALLNNLAIKGGEALIPFESLLNTTKASFACIESIKQHSWINIK